MSGCFTHSTLKLPLTVSVWTWTKMSPLHRGCHNYSLVDLVLAYREISLKLCPLKCHLKHFEHDLMM